MLDTCTHKVLKQVQWLKNDKLCLLVILRYILNENVSLHEYGMRERHIRQKVVLEIYFH